MGQRFTQSVARMPCLFSMMVGLSARISQIAGGWNSCTATKNLSFYIQPFYLGFILAWKSALYMVAQGSKREHSKRQKIEDASLLRPMSRNFNSVTYVTYC